jgi:hypothetical protein
MRDYQNFSKEELIKEIEKLKKQKKFGLIWEEENVVENFDKLSINSYPILEEIENKKRAIFIALSLFLYRIC